MTEYLTVKEIANLFHWSTGTVYNRLSQGKGMPPSIVIGRKRLFPADQCQQWVKEKLVDNSLTSL
jgi:excisionase family DNA binding protein